MNNARWKGMNWRTIAGGELKWALDFLRFWLVLLGVFLIALCSDPRVLAQLSREIALHPSSGPGISHLLGLFAWLVFLALVVMEVIRLTGTVYRQVATQNAVLAKKIQAYALIFGGLILIGVPAILLHAGSGSSRPVPPPKPPVFRPFVGTRYRVLIHEEVSKKALAYTRNIVGPAEVKALGSNRYLVQLLGKGDAE